MSLRLPATPVRSEAGSDDGSQSSVDDAEETWSDWLSDSGRLCKSLFDDKTFPSAADSLKYDKDTHGFDLSTACQRLGLDFHGRIRLINYIRKEKPQVDAIGSLTGQEGFLSADEYLVPVIEDDPLLLENSESWSDSDDDAANAPTDLRSALRRISALEAKIAKSKQDLSDYQALVTERLDISRLKDAVEGADAAVASGSGGTRDDDTHYFQSYEVNDIHAVMIQDKVRTSSYASFIMSNPALFHDAIVLDVGCGTGILSLFAARAGAKHVYAVDASDIAEKAKKIVAENGLGDVITVLHGKVEQVSLPEGVTHVDVIISEWMGYALLYESMLDSVLQARDRFLKPGGVMAPSQCKMMLGLSDASEILKERVGFWNDVYGFDLSTMSEAVYDEAIMDIVGPETMVSNAYAVKDIYLRDVTTRQLDFSAPFTLVSTAERRTKVHAFLLYFDTFFTPDGNRIPEDAKAQVTKDAGLAEVWQLGRRPSRRASQSVKPQMSSFSTGPLSAPTHWKHTIFLLRDPIIVEEGTVVEGIFHCKKSDENSRELDVEVHYSVKENVDAEMPGERIVQIFKVR
ncbi:S-adenosyl-L-methionine-dependent methyltransferase [Auriscalpium vulgare]|uniref:S-adenosyl-L-methionine-dependent methyltransferase n=1 Tax=Auriscalpium vulgare TaxID=40419 RepID=A0ACB8RPL2_9AGAM|nr:S-adenosyl-L-methionine-dependent methyltransferase [Auriscalpium vulgare]